MSVLPILQVPEALLRRPSQEVREFDEGLVALANILTATRRHWNGFGLAAPQVGSLFRIIALNPGRTVGFPIMVNPMIAKHGNNKSTAEEGCLSIAAGKQNFRVKRWDTIIVLFQTPDGDHHERVARGLAARVIQHEIDHLDGILIDGGKPEQRGSEHAAA